VLKTKLLILLFTVYGIANGQINLTVSSTPVVCYGQCNGTAYATANGGISPYTYLWSTTETTQSITGLCVGNYTVTVTDAISATANATVTITQPFPVSNTVTVTNASCFGCCDGSATGNVSGGTAPYTYQWLPGSQSTPSISGLCAGNYTLCVTDANGCITCTSAVITQPVQLLISTSQTNVSCYGLCDGTATAMPSGGTSPYTYSWSTSPAQTTSSATGLCAGMYTITVTDAASATASATVNIQQPAPLSVTVTVNANASCSGCCDGSATGSVTGGTPAYSYLWWPSGGITPTETGMCAGTYSLCITDANGCYTCASVLITQPNITANFSNTSVCFNNPTCFTDLSSSSNGAITSWDWDFNDGNFLCCTTQNPCHTYAVPGTYIVTLIATNSNGDKDTVSYPVNVYPLPSASFSSSTVCFGNPTCFTDLSTITSGTITGWSWNFDDPSSGGNNVSSLQNPCHTFTSAGLFNVVMTVTSDSGCQSTTVLPVTVNQNPTATSTANPTSIISGNSTTLSASGGGTYSWYPSTGLSSTTGATVVATPTSTITYCVIVTASNGCTDTSCVTVFVTPTGIQLFSNNKLVSLFPNPATDYFTIETQENRKYVLRVTNNIGKQIIKQSFQKKIEVNVSAFGKGLFLVEVYDELGTKCHTQKVLIE